MLHHLVPHNFITIIMFIEKRKIIKFLGISHSVEGFLLYFQNPLVFFFQFGWQGLTGTADVKQTVLKLSLRKYTDAKALNNKHS
jgi:hypothetical protein